jgi:hypothetical protein
MRIHSEILSPVLLREIELPVRERVPVITLTAPNEGVISPRRIIDAIVSTVPGLPEVETQILSCESKSLVGSYGVQSGHGAGFVPTTAM